jgi:hypothetical protein
VKNNKKIKKLSKKGGLKLKVPKIGIKVENTPLGGV